MLTQTELAKWLQARFTGDRAGRDWQVVVDKAWDTLLQMRAGDLLPPDRIEALVLAYLTEERIADAVRPAIRVHLTEAVDMMRADHKKLGRWVPVEARKAMFALVSRKGLVDPAWLTALFKEEAIEAIVSDTLYTAIREFSTIIPRVVQTQILGRLGRLGGLGGGIVDKVIDEMERILEPEIRKYLIKGARRALDGAARFAIDHLDDPTSLALRRNTIDFVLDQEVAFFVRGLGDDMLEEIDHIAELVARHVGSLEESKEKAKEAVARAHAKYGDRPLGEVLVDIGVTERPPLSAWADALWPILDRLMTSQAAEPFFMAIAGEICEAMSKP